MSNQPSARNYLQAEAVDFRSPVSESMLKTFAGTQNWLLDKDSSNDGTIAAIQAAASVLTGRVNNAVSFSVVKTDIVLTAPYGRYVFTTTANQFSIIVFRGDVSSGTQQFGVTTQINNLFTSGSLHLNTSYLLPSGTLDIYFDDPSSGTTFSVYEIKMTYNHV